MVEELREARRRKLDALREQGHDPFAHTRYEHTADTASILATYGDLEAGEQADARVRIAGRLLGRRVMGGASFFDLGDEHGTVQLYAAKDHLGQDAYRAVTELEIGDIVGVAGPVLRTRRGELSVQVEEIALLAKALRPLPEKWHGLKDVEARYRQRHLDLIANPQVRESFKTRTRMIRAMRDFLDSQGFWEVETPILQPLYGGAFATPFTTHHEALDETRYLRIAVELYLKRLIVGGFERVYEIGRNFRNEGISTKHNPEFTMMECYEAYADYRDMMARAEQMIAHIGEELGQTHLVYQGQTIDLTPPWPRMTLREAIRSQTEIDIETHRDHASLQQAVRDRNLRVDPKPTWGGLVDEILGEYVEPELIQPTFLMDYPIEISPLAKQKPDAPHLVERFELFIAGYEMGNAFSELNDPLDQRQRFLDQQAQRAQGEAEAQKLDEDFLEALEHGMPPTGGLGVGVDRLAMLMTDTPSIREVILFPTLRSRPQTPEGPAPSTEASEDGT